MSHYSKLMIYDQLERNVHLIVLKTYESCSMYCIVKAVARLKRHDLDLDEENAKLTKMSSVTHGCTRMKCPIITCHNDACDHWLQDGPLCCIKWWGDNVMKLTTWRKCICSNIVYHVYQRAKMKNIHFWYLAWNDALGEPKTFQEEGCVHFIFPDKSDVILNEQPLNDQRHPCPG